jgi:hypothetical protein
MEKMGYSPNALLVEAKRRLESGVEARGCEKYSDSCSRPFIRLLQKKEEVLGQEDMDGGLDGYEEQLMTPCVSGAETQQEQIQEILDQKVQEARAADLSESGCQRL